MSAFWASRPSGLGLRASFATLACAALLHGTAAASGTRVSIGPKDIVVVSDSSREDDADTSIVIGGHDGGWISVDNDGDALVRVFADVHIRPGERVMSDVVAVFGSVDVEGEVDGDVVAVFGSVKLHDSAVVGGDVVSVGGVLDQGEGADVQGQTISVGLMSGRWGIPTLPFLLGSLVAGWIAALFTAWIFTLLFPSRFLRVATVASRRTGASLVLGLASLPGFVMLIVLLFVTVVGIPLAFLVPLAYALLAYAGQLAATYLLGTKLTARPLGSPGLMLPTVVGTLFVASFFFLGAILFAGPGPARPFGLFAVLLGSLLCLGLTLIGTGAFLLSKFGSEPREVSWGAAPGEAAQPLAQPAPSQPSTP